MFLKVFNVKSVFFSELKNLLEYHLHIIKSDFKPNYEKLREGLDEYFIEYLSDFWDYLNIGDTNKSLLDYGCGNGCYSDQFIYCNPDGSAYKVDRNIDDCIDFENNPNWYKDHLNKFDLVLLSEILHCKDDKGKEYLIESSLETLKEKGKIIINENIDPFMGWRLNRMTKGGDVLNERDILKLMNKYEVKLVDLLTINNHKIYVYEAL